VFELEVIPIQMKLLERQRFWLYRFSKRLGKRSGKPCVVEGRSVGLLLRVDDNELMAARDRPAIDKTVPILEPIGLIGKVRHKAAIFLLQIERPLVIGRTGLRTQAGREHECRQENRNRICLRTPKQAGEENQVPIQHQSKASHLEYSFPV